MILQPPNVLIIVDASEEDVACSRRLRFTGSVRALSTVRHGLRVQQRSSGGFQRGRAHFMVDFRTVVRHSHRQRTRR